MNMMRIPSANIIIMMHVNLLRLDRPTVVLSESKLLIHTIHIMIEFQWSNFIHDGLVYVGLGVSQ